MVTIAVGRGTSWLRRLALLVCLLSLTLGAATTGLAATLTGTVRNDLNGNGVIDAADPPLAGILVQLRTGATRGFTIAQTTSDANGFYGFTNIGQGTYRLVQVPPQGTLAISAQAGAGGVVVSSTTIRFTLNGSEVIGGNNFLDRTTTVVSPTNGIINGRVFRDTNGNNVIDGLDVGISGVLVQLSTGLGVPVASTLTDFTGAYSFTSLPPGTYRVVETDPANHGSVAAFGGVNGFPLDVNTIQVTVQSGVNSANNNFLDRQTVVSPTVGSISGIVARDTNGNNVIDGQDVALNGVAVQLFTQTGIFIAQTVTGGGGAYSFANLPPGFYRVMELDPANHFSVAAFAGANGFVQDANNILVSVFAGVNSGNNNFLDRLTVVSPTTGSISGSVIRDTNGNSLIDGADVGIPGVTVQLWTGLNVFITQTTTAANGTFSFANLPPGTYRVVEVDPPNHGSVGAAAGLNGFVLTANIIQVNVVAGADSSNQRFLDRQTVVSPTTGSISGSVIRDTNGNSLIDAFDVGIPGVTVQLFTALGVPVASTVTAANGTFSFPTLPPGTYLVQEVDPANHVSVGAAAGVNGFVLNANLIQVNVVAGIDSGNQRFLDRQTVVLPTTGSISGTVLRDTNGNGSIDAGDVGIGGVTIQLWIGLNQFITQTTTAANGTFSFANLPPGTYQVVEVDPANHFSLAAVAGVNGAVLNANTIQVNVVANVDASGQRFLDRLIGAPPGGANTISGFAIRDANLNGRADSEPGLAGMQVTLSNQFGTPLATVVTNVTGTFNFSGLPNGTYVLTATPPAGLFSTNAIAGQNGLRLGANSIQVTTSLGLTSYPGHLFLAGP